jgi:hypothetical protein
MDIAQDGDDEGMDVKAKALTRLLQTSSVSLPRTQSRSRSVLINPTGVRGNNGGQDEGTTEEAAGRSP